MTITDLVAPEAILPALKVNSKKQALQELAAKAAELTGQNERAVFEVLLQREKLGTTAVGYGVAIPHGKLPKLEKIFGLFARLERQTVTLHNAIVKFSADSPRDPTTVVRRWSKVSRRLAPLQ